MQHMVVIKIGHRLWVCEPILGLGVSPPNRTRPSDVPHGTKVPQIVWIRSNSSAQEVRKYTA